MRPGVVHLGGVLVKQAVPAGAAVPDLMDLTGPLLPDTPLLVGYDYSLYRWVSKCSGISGSGRPLGSYEDLDHSLWLCN